VFSDKELSLLKQGRYDELLTYVKQEIENSPDDMDLRKDLIFTYWSCGRFYEAIEIYEDFLPEIQKFTDLVVTIGNAYYRIDNYEKAIKTLNSVINNDKESIDPQALSLAHSNLGVVYEALSKFELAVKEYRIALNIFPDNWMAKKYLDDDNLAPFK